MEGVLGKFRLGKGDIGQQQNGSGCQQTEEVFHQSVFYRVKKGVKEHLKNKFGVNELL